MDPERWRRARDLFDRLADQPPGSWDASLAELCPDDPEVRAEARALLAADFAAAGATDLQDRARAAAAEVAARVESTAADRLAGTRVGPYRLVRELGRGGMGAVWLAERADGEFTREVAVKLIRPGWDAGEMLARFRAERQILAGLAHPNIAALLDGGVTPDGKPWLALELVDGVDVLTWCDTRRLPIASRLRLFLTVCEAVSHAHARLVVHRDIKPSNLLVTADGQPKLLDFGIAKLVAPEAGGAASQTRIFTPEYAAPEQVKGEPVTTAVDVYALGLLLYALLTGRRPYQAQGSTPAAYERAILDQEPTRPSLAVERALEALDDDPAPLRATTRERLRDRLRGDLDAIVLKALREEPTERYASVAALAADVAAWLDRRPVLARRGGWRYRTTRFLRRHAVASGLAAAAALSLLGGLGAALWQADEARQQRDAALSEARKSRALLDLMSGLFEVADPSQARGERVTARELLRVGALRVGRELRDEPAARAELLAALSGAFRGLGLYRDALPLAEEAVALAERSGDRRVAATAELRYAEALHETGEFAAALARLDALRARLLGDAARPADESAAAALLARVDFRRGRALQAVERLDEAETAYLAAHAAQVRLHGAADRRTQDTQVAYLSLLVLRDQEPVAEQQARDLLTAVRAAVGDDDPQLADALGALAMVVVNTGDTVEAERLRREELAIVERAYGADHPRATRAANDLAGTLYAQRRFPEAAALYSRVLPQRREQLGSDHPAAATIATNLAWCTLELGNYAEGKAWAEEALRVRLAAFGEEHHNTALTLRVLGSLHAALGDLATAQQYYERAVASFAASLGPDSRTGLGALNDLNWIRLLRGVPQPGCELAERALAIATRGGAEPGSPELAYQEALLGACKVANGGEGEPRLTAALATLRSTWGEDDERTLKVLRAAAAARRR